ncbi:hypothetical protein ABIB25_000124 [Nakamurella sp. UYEF19]|uniref:YciI family protein n=1 Tax=Nakamurella sp. UYEF19 TaxID=1756392 RepID=UPI003390DCE2
MQFMTMLKAREDIGMPPPAFFAAMATYLQDVAATGKLVTTGGLLPSAVGVQVKAVGGEIIVTDGPFTEFTELVGGYAIFEVDSREEAVAMARSFIELHLLNWPGWEGSSEVRQIMQAPGA